MKLSCLGTRRLIRHPTFDFIGRTFICRRCSAGIGLPEDGDVCARFFGTGVFLVVQTVVVVVGVAVWIAPNAIGLTKFDVYLR